MLLFVPAVGVGLLPKHKHSSAPCHGRYFVTPVPSQALTLSMGRAFSEALARVCVDCTRPAPV